MIKISILIPIYNAEKYLESCLQSIISQSLEEIEIICVNDGSTDRSLEILKYYQKIDNRIIIINKKNNGASLARNTALKKARGEYCLNIDSDDWIEQGYLEDIYSKAKKENLDILITDYILYSTKLNKKEKKKDLNIDEEEIISGIQYLKLFFSNNFYGYTWNKLIKRELYFYYNITYNKNIFLLEDVEILGKLSYYAKRIGKLSKAYYNYRIGENNNSFKYTLKSLTDVRECFKSLEKFYEKVGEEKIKEMVTRKKNIHLIGLFLSGKFDEYPSFSKILSEYLDEIKNDKFISFFNYKKIKMKCFGK